MVLTGGEGETELLVAVLTRRSGGQPSGEAEDGEAEGGVEASADEESQPPGADPIGTAGVQVDGAVLEWVGVETQTSSAESEA